MKLKTFKYQNIFNLFPSFMIVKTKPYYAVLSWGYWGILFLK
jgi:hypothetical protein